MWSQEIQRNTATQTNRESQLQILHLKKGIYECCFFLRSLNFDVSDSVWKLEFSGPIALYLREYPIPFGRKIVDLYSELTSTAKGFSKAPDSLPPAMESFERMPFEDPGFGLEFAALEEVYTYLRKSKHLHIPFHWKHLVPRKAFKGPA